MKHLLIAAIVGAVCIGLPPLTGPIKAPSSTALSILTEAATAQADVKRRKVRRAARRTTRRVIRRHQYYRALPRGCIRAAVRGTWYWRCGGVYYRELVEDGATVYIIVTP